LPNHIPDGRTSPQGQINAKQIKTGSGEILWSKKNHLIMKWFPKVGELLI